MKKPRVLSEARLVGFNTTQTYLESGSIETR
jgi:hypothetical protein